MELQIVCIARSVDHFLDVDDEKEAQLMQKLTSMKVCNGPNNTQYPILS